MTATASLLSLAFSFAILLGERGELRGGGHPGRSWGAAFMLAMLPIVLVDSASVIYQRRLQD